MKTFSRQELSSPEILKSADDVINDIIDVLVQADEYFLEEIANKVLSNKIKYIGDSLFKEI